MKKKLFVLIALFIFSMGLTRRSHAQAFLNIDSLVYGDSTATIDVSGYDDFYLDIYNANADSTNAVYIYDVNYAGWTMPVYLIATSAAYNWSSAANVTLSAATKYSYKIFGGGFKYIRLLFSAFEGKTNRIDFVLKGMKKVQF